MDTSIIIPTYTKKEVLELLVKWQNILNLQDWKIVSCVISKLSEKDCAATVVWDFLNRSAVICILDHKAAIKLSKEYIDQFNLEETIVHELLHIFFSSYSSDLKMHLHSKFDTVLTLMARVLISLHKNESSRHSKN